MNEEREIEILKTLIQQKQVSVNELAEKMYTSKASIRRDPKSLEPQHLLRRVHGGAILEENSISRIKIPFLLRELEQSDEKIQLAKYAADLVENGNVIFLDASTSAYHIIPYLAPKKDLTVITNGIKALTRLSEYNIRCIGTGGTVFNSCLAFVGEAACCSVEQYYADICFFSSRGLSEDGMLTDISQEENMVRQKMIAHAKASYALFTEGKIGKQYFHRLCAAGDLTGVITGETLRAQKDAAPDG